VTFGVGSGQIVRIIGFESASRSMTFYYGDVTNDQNAGRNKGQQKSRPRKSKSQPQGNDGQDRCINENYLSRNESPPKGPTENDECHPIKADAILKDLKDEIKSDQAEMRSIICNSSLS
jgi:hypothetical protein